MRGKPTSPGGLREFGVGRSGRAGGDGHVVGEGEVAGGDLVAEERQGLGGGADEDKPGIGAGPGEVGAFAEEAVSGVDGLASLRPGGGDDGLDVEVGVGGGVAFEEDDLVGEAGGEAVAVGHGGGEHGAHAEPRRVRMTRTAISPRFATRTASNMGGIVGAGESATCGRRPSRSRGWGR